MSQYIEPTDVQDYDDDTPLPLLVAERWGFNLRCVFEDETYWYSVRDWIAGLTSSDNPKQAWQSARKALEMQPILESIRRIRMPGNGGSPAQIIDDKGLYHIAANLRVTQNRPALAEIKNFLAKAGAFADLARRDPEQAELSLQKSRRQKYIRQGKEPEWIAIREFGIITRKQLMAVVMDLLSTNEHMDIITNDTYRGVFGMTAEQLRRYIGIPNSTTLRDHFSTLALVYIQAAEESCRIQLEKYDEDEIVAHEDVRAIMITLARLVGKQAKEMSEMLGIDVVTGSPLLESGLTKEEFREILWKVGKPKQ